MLYFAHGSNMNWSQMRERCPSSRFVGIAVLRDHRLAFTRKSICRNCGVADVVAEHDRNVWGVVYKIDEPDVSKLDKSEGFRPGREKNSYYRCECLVLMHGDAQRPITVSTYFADPQPNPPLPNAEYKNLILVGARHWQLPAEYIRELDRIEVSG